MQNKLIATATSTALSVLVAFFAVGGSPTLAQTANNSLKTDLSMATPSRITQGEPIVLQYRVANVSSRSQEMSIYPEATSFMTQSFVDADGKVTDGYRPLDTNTTDDHVVYPVLCTICKVSVLVIQAAHLPPEFGSVSVAKPA